MINITHQSFNKDQSQSLPDASVEHQHVLVRVVPPVASPEGCSVRATNVTTWPSVLRVHDAGESFPWWEKGFSQKAIKLAFWFDNVQKFHVHSIITFLLFFKSRKNQVKQKTYLMSRGHLELHTIHIQPPLHSCWHQDSTEMRQQLDQSTWFAWLDLEKHSKCCHHTQ